MQQITERKPYMDRIDRLKERVLNTRPEMDLEDAVILTKGFQESEGEMHVIQKAHAFRKQCREKSVKIWDDELIVGNAGSKQRGGLLSVDTCWSVLEEELDTISTRRYDPFYLTDEDRKAFEEIIRPYWKGRSTYEKWLVQCPKEAAILRDCGAVYINRKAVRGFGETTAGYQTIIEDGIEGILEHVAKVEATLDIATAGDYERLTYLRAVRIAAEGICDLADRYAAEAERLAGLEKDKKRKKELLTIAETCRRVPKYPARTFQEAIQGLFIYQCCLIMEQNAASYNPGRLDQYLYPFYKADIEAGRLTHDEAQELLECLWVKFSEQCLFQDAVTAQFSAGYPMFQNVCCGGVDSRGMDAVNDVSYMMLQATADVQLYQPSLSVRYNMAKNPDKFLKKVAEVIKLGTGFPAFHNDDVGIEMIMNKGIPMREAFDWNPCGCVETNLAGKQRCYTAYADYNLGAAVEYALLNGMSRKYGVQASLKTGDPCSFTTYEEFENAVREQIKWTIRQCIVSSHVNDDICMERTCPVLSMTFYDCIEKGKDYATGGAKYNLGNGIDAIGVADVINSLIAVKKIVFEEKTATMKELLEALAADFVGYDRIKKLCDDAPKYGNDDDETNELTADLFSFIADYTESFTSRFGRMQSGILPVSGNTPFGIEVGALPSGRRAWKPLADGISPNQGTDTEGMGAVLKSTAFIPQARFDQGTLLNLKLDTSFRERPNSTRELMNFLKSLCSLHVFHAQFNVIDTETLIDAKVHPEDHDGMLVRVAGYTAYFTELGGEVQDDIISRSSHSKID